MINDLVSDVLVRIKNGSDARHKFVVAPSSKVVLEILRVLKEEGFIKDFDSIQIDGKPFVKIHLKYGPNKEPSIVGIRRISKPGRRIYVKKDELPKVFDGFGIAIISTPQGIMSDKMARKLGHGGEVVCFVW
ncbi:30S ribosomal protein S8 [Caldisericum exile]|uniref:Small ribosomal subunit protein uS8 n=1 Tax=Caldisericum exile (strain DSM 21853 / NBRC 104410 / AZM16c01) TaxID=511051 RepID=A0A7U6GF55_CALEA|nr:30S ribosomal protein S8 [Caldisericum exile]BAL81253.1 30S ribosomal protein S8 [Caldisericum exile AZM16c01]